MPRFVRSFAVVAALLVGLFITFGGARAEAGLPKDQAEFDKRLSAEAQTPEGALQLWFEAIYLYSNGNDLGLQMLETLTKGLIDGWQKKTGTSRFASKLKEEAHIFRSYAKAATPENGYTMDPENFELNIVSSAQDSDTTWIIALKSSGADSSRKVTLTKNDAGLWIVTKYDSIYLGIKAAQK